MRHPHSLYRVLAGRRREASRAAPRSWPAPHPGRAHPRTSRRQARHGPPDTGEPSPRGRYSGARATRSSTPVRRSLHGERGASEGGVANSSRRAGLGPDTLRRRAHQNLGRQNTGDAGSSLSLHHRTSPRRIEDFRAETPGCDSKQNAPTSPGPTRSQARGTAGSRTRCLVAAHVVPLPVLGYRKSSVAPPTVCSFQSGMSSMRRATRCRRAVQAEVFARSRVREPAWAV